VATTGSVFDVLFFIASKTAIAPATVAGTAIQIAYAPKHGIKEPNIPMAPKTSDTTERAVTAPDCGFWSVIFLVFGFWFLVFGQYW
jgi:hypothetical protein